MHFDILSGFNGYWGIHEEGPGGPDGTFTYGGFVKSFGGEVIASVSGRTSRAAVAKELREMVWKHQERMEQEAA